MGLNQVTDYKKLSPVEKVQLLENAVLSQSVEKVKDVLDNCDSFEFTARALGLSSLYGKREVVELLIKNGAVFKYKYSPALKKKYGCAYKSYEAEYSPMIAGTDVNVFSPQLGGYFKSMHFGDLPKKLPEKTPRNERADIATILYKTRKKTGFKESRALYYAILWGCRPVAVKLMEL